MVQVINTIGMANGFARLGHDCTFLCWQAPNGAVAPAELRRNFGYAEGVNVVQMRRTMLGRPLNEQLYFGLQVAVHARSLKPDVSYCRSYIAPVTLSAMGMPV